MRLDSGQQARGCDGQPTVAWMEHLGAGHGQNFIARRCSEGQGKGDGFPQPNGCKWVGLRNGMCPRSSETDTQGPWGTGDRLAATQGRKRRGPVWRNGLG
jgi:hypothetical protein